MNKRGLRLKVGQFGDTLKKSPLKEQSEDEADIQSHEESNEQQPTPEAHHHKQHQFVQFEEFNIDSRASVLKQTKRRVETEYQKYQQPINSARMIKEAFPEGGTTPQQSYRKRDNDSPSKELQACRKQLMIKDGIISALQKLINQHLGKGEFKDKDHHGWDDILRTSSDKDAKLHEYIEKITQLSQQIRLKNQDIAKYRHENYKLQATVQNLENDLYILKSRQQNSRLTRDFQLKKQFGNYNRTKPNSFWEQDIRPSFRPEGYVRNIDDLQKRLDMLKQNRIQLQRSKSRNKGKTARESTNDILKQDPNWLSQSTKNTKNKSILQIHLPRERYEQTFIDRKGKKQIH